MRFAVYYTPEPGTGLAEFGARWLSQDPAISTEPAKSSSVLDVAVPHELRQRAIAAPAKYGLHATLKAPFRLAEGVTSDDLHNGCAHLAASLPAIVTAPLQLSNLRGFLALTLPRPDERMAGLEAACVIRLDHLRAPLTPTDKERRNPAALTHRQRELLDEVGYPFALDEFYFHMTLTSQLDADDAAVVEPALRAAVTPLLGKHFSVDTICLMEDREDGQPFRVAERFKLA